MRFKSTPGYDASIPVTTSDEPNAYQQRDLEVVLVEITAARGAQIGCAKPGGLKGMPEPKLQAHLERPTTVADEGADEDDSESNLGT